MNQLNQDESAYGEEVMANAILNDQPVKCLRDTGSTITLIKVGVIKNSESAKEYTVCSTAFGTRHTIPLVWVTIKTTYGCGRMKVGVVQDLPVDCVIGNDTNKLIKLTKTETCAATTRA